MLRATKLSEQLYSHTTLRGIPSKVSPLSRSDQAEITRGLAKRVHGFFASRKNRKSLAWRSHYEHDLFRLLEVDPSVVSFEALSARVTYKVGASERSHVPAAVVKTVRGTIILDAFSDDTVQRRRDFIARIISIYAARHLSYRVLRASQLNVLPRMDNARFILGYRDVVTTQETAFPVLHLLTTRAQMNLRDIEMAVPGGSAVACALAMEGRIALDLSAVQPMMMMAQLNRGGARQ